MTSKAVLVVAFAVILAICCQAKPTVTAKKASNDWWKHAVFYQIYPRSFKDSDGDGIGDLKGIISKMDHLKDAGVTSAWLSPIYKSPQVDAGYDISDYKDIHKEYGTLEDFDDLVKKANELDIKIVMDFVPNHSSDQHDWFKKSENSEPGYEDYYVWANGRDNDDKTPPNNWVSVFKYSAWKYSDVRKQWYLHQFAYQQPDLNFNNPKVVNEMKDVLKFWMDRGVYGFRIDAVPHIHETGMEDEPPSGNTNLEEYEYDYLNHIYTKDQQATYDLIYEFRAFIDEYNNDHPDEDERIMMTEAYTSITNTMRYYGDGNKRGAHFSFNFELIPVSSQSSARDIVLSIQKWMTYMPLEYTPNWVIGNHDNHRVATRVGLENADGFNMLVSMLPGVAVTYNGEEIGMEDGYVSWEQGKDPSACNGSPEKFNSTSRDFERTPYQWDDTKNAGFSDGDTTWLPVSEKYVHHNLAQQQNEEYSHYGIYKKLTSLRKQSEVLKEGKMEIVAYSDKVMLLRRYKASLGNDHYLFFNLGSRDEKVDLTKVFGTLPSDLKIHLSSKGTTGTLEANNVVLHGHEAIIAM